MRIENTDGNAAKIVQFVALKNLFTKKKSSKFTGRASYIGNGMVSPS